MVQAQKVTPVLELVSVAIAFSASESQSKPGIKMVYPEPCKEVRRRPQLFLVGIVPYKPSSTRVLIVTQVRNGVGTRVSLPDGMPGHAPLVCSAPRRLARPTAASMACGVFGNRGFVGVAERAGGFLVGGFGHGKPIIWWVDLLSGEGGG